MNSKKYYYYNGEFTITKFSAGYFAVVYNNNGPERQRLRWLINA